MEAGELFRLEGNPGETLTIVPAAANLDKLGAGMTRGRLLVEGDAGALAASGLAGGHVRVQGDAGGRAGAGMVAGNLEITGSCGDCLGGPLIGTTHGMAGGMIRVGGSAGHRAGERLRRGLVVIDGDAGDYLGANMIAGTIAVAGRAGTWCGSGMRRGTLILARQPASMPATFNANGPRPPGFLALFRPLLGSAWAPLMANDADPFSRFLGDLAEEGMGEVLIAV
ncbi:MAG: formylmethanofuran dehydrogenase subunit C [Gammaproteobacteria bacterium]|nr:formylmethanofuran dehydrogenase subunit C [Gammaproteobacteria bacterium]